KFSFLGYPALKRFFFEQQKADSKMLSMIGAGEMIRSYLSIKKNLSLSAVFLKLDFLESTPICFNGLPCHNWTKKFLLVTKKGMKSEEFIQVTNTLALNCSHIPSKEYAYLVSMGLTESSLPNSLSLCIH